MILNADVCATDYSQPTTDWTNDPSWIMNMEAFYTDKSSSGRRSLNNSSQDVSKLEALSMMRDAKRRRQSYRGIHTARKSYTEILREIIAQQTEMLTAAQESIQQSEDKRSSSVESFESNKEIVKRRHGSNKYNKPNTPTSRQIYPSDDSRYGKTNNSSEQSRIGLPRRRRYNSRRRDGDDSNKQPTCQYSPSIADYRYNNSGGDYDDVDNNKPKKSKKHKKHSKSKHKHKHKS
ncbi:unnamed protein product [Trichobilharzia szidati]|nr:unnamed protein product [Trichobilharzia szidati]